MENQRYSHIILGGGAAGCVLASRLSAASRNRVLLVEAGMDTPPDTVPADILDPYPLSYSNPQYRWPLLGHALTAARSPAAPLLHGRVMGGGSSIMGMVMLRGIPADYDGWAAQGAQGWAWQDVLPYFRSLENDLDYSSHPLHGNEGATEIRRHAPEGWPNITKGALRFAQAQSLPLIEDMNADFRDGFGVIPIAGTPTRRASAALSYLTEEVRRRPNLDILANARAQSLIFEGRRAVGAHIELEGRQLSFHGEEIVLAMGALLTPHFLLRQGIGDPALLQQAGIDVRVASPGVGKNLQNHAAVVIVAHLMRQAVQRHPQRNHNDAMFRYSSSLPGCPPSDMALMFGTRTSWHELARRVAHFSPVVMAPASRGRVTLGAGDAPLVEYNLLGDPRDEAKLVDGLARAGALLASGEMAGLLGLSVGASKLGKAAAFNQRNWSNAIRAGVLAAAMDHVPGFGSMAMKSLAGQGDTLENLVTDPERAREFIRKSVQPLAHHAGTCRMGPADDPHAVVDAAGRVHNAGNLRVADASVMPFVPRANTNLPVLMLAEKLAAAMLAG